VASTQALITIQTMRCAEEADESPAAAELRHAIGDPFPTSSWFRCPRARFTDATRA